MGSLNTIIIRTYYTDNQYIKLADIRFNIFFVCLHKLNNMKTIMSKKEELQHLKELLNDKYYIQNLTPKIIALIEFNN